MEHQTELDLALPNVSVKAMKKGRMQREMGKNEDRGCYFFPQISLKLHELKKKTLYKCLNSSVLLALMMLLSLT